MCPQSASSSPSLGQRVRSFVELGIFGWQAFCARITTVVHACRAGLGLSYRDAGACGPPGVRDFRRIRANFVCDSYEDACFFVGKRMYIDARSCHPILVHAPSTLHPCPHPIHVHTSSMFTLRQCPRTVDVHTPSMPTCSCTSYTNTSRSPMCLHMHLDPQPKFIYDFLPV